MGGSRREKVKLAQVHRTKGRTGLVLEEEKQGTVNMRMSDVK